MDVKTLIVELEKLSDRDLGAVVGSVLQRVMKVTLTKPAVTLDLFLTFNCNLRCDYCFVEGKDQGQVMPLSTAQKGVDFVIEQSAHKKEIEIVFFGGEPLLELDLMRSVAAYARSSAAEKGKTVRFSITTNGTLLNDSALEFAEEFGILYMLSLDGAQATHDSHRRTIDGTGSFNRIVSRLPLLKQRQEWLAARITVSPDTAASLATDIRTLFDMGINQFFVEPDFFADWSTSQIAGYREQYQRLADLYIELRTDNQPIRIIDFESSLEDRRSRYAGRWGCHAGRGRLTVTPDGVIYPCNRFAGLGNGAAVYRLGDLSEGLTEYKQIRDLMDDRDNVRPKCMNCSIADYCQGGCPAANLATGGTIYTVPPICCAHTQALASVLRERPEILEHRWSTESPIKACCGDEPPCADLFPVGSPGKHAESPVTANT